MGNSRGKKKKIEFNWMVPCRAGPCWAWRTFTPDITRGWLVVAIACVCGTFVCTARCPTEIKTNTQTATRREGLNINWTFKLPKLKCVSVWIWMWSRRERTTVLAARRRRGHSTCKKKAQKDAYRVECETDGERIGEQSNKFHSSGRWLSQHNTTTTTTTATTNTHNLKKERFLSPLVSRIVSCRWSSFYPPTHPHPHNRHTTRDSRQDDRSNVVKQNAKWNSLSSFPRFFFLLFFHIKKRKESNRNARL